MNDQNSIWDVEKYLHRLNSKENNIDNYYNKKLRSLSIGTKILYLVSICKLFDTNERRNKNRGYRKLEVWSRAIEFYVFVSKRAYSLKGKPYRVINQLIGSAYSVHANIAEGYCRRSLGEYLYFLWKCVFMSPRNGNKTKTSKINNLICSARSKRRRIRFALKLS